MAEPGDLVFFDLFIDGASANAKLLCFTFAHTVVANRRERGEALGEAQSHSYDPPSG
jgi:hypothetical protein